MATVAQPRGNRPPHSAGTQLDLEAHGPGVAIPRSAITVGIMLVLWVVYGFIGYRTTVDAHVVIFDALDRLTRAFLVWHNDPPKLAAIGFFYPPLDTMVLLPSAIPIPLAVGLTALSVTSGLFAALTIAVLDRTLARCDMPFLFRIPLLVGFAFNPLWLFYSGNGMAEAVYSAFLAIGLYFFISWYVTAEPRYLIGSGLTFSVLVLVRYGFIVYALILSILIGVALARRHARRVEVEGSVIAFAAPVMYVLAIWILFNALIVGDPFGWVGSATSTQAVNSTGVGPVGDLSFNDVARRLVQLNVAVFPLAFLVVPGLVVAFVTQRNDMALWLSSLIVIGIVLIGANALITDNEGLLTLRDSFPMMVAAFVGAGWLYRSFVGARLLLWIVTFVILIGGWFLAWHGMKTYPFQSLEQSYTRTLFTGKSQEGTSSIGGYTVGIDPESQMAAYVKKNVSGRNAILTDNSKTFGPILLSSHPERFFLRVDKGDKKWKEILNDPWGKVNYMLVTNNPNSGDLIPQRYPNIAKGGAAGFTPVFATQRYTIVKVASTAPASATKTTTKTGATGNSTTTSTTGTAGAGTATTATTARTTTTKVGVATTSTAAATGSGATTSTTITTP